MAEWANWIILAGVLLILEIFTGTFYLLMIAIGFAAGGIAALLGTAGAAQFIVAGVVGVLATFLLHRSKLGKSDNPDAARDRNVNLDIGESIVIDEWTMAADASPSARVMYRGALWDVDLAPGLPAESGTYVITEVRGSRLIVSRH